MIQSRGEILFEGFAADWVLAHLQAARSSQKSGDLTASRRYTMSSCKSGSTQTTSRLDDRPSASGMPCPADALSLSGSRWVQSRVDQNTANPCTA